MPGLSRNIGVVRLGFRQAKGFSLIELIAAFLVFALGVGVLMQVLTTSLRNSRLSAEYTQAALWAQSLLDTLGVGEPLQEQQSSGQFDNSYRWALDVQKIDPTSVAVTASTTAPATPLESAAEMGAETVAQDNTMELYQVDLTVLWGNQPQEHQAHFMTLKAIVPDGLEGLRDQGAKPSSKQPGNTSRMSRPNK